MAGGKQTPRQRMIGILYLVLLGLIALDVPENLLDAFKHIGDSLITSTANIEVGINQEFKDFNGLPNKTDRDNKIGERAKNAKILADQLTQLVDSLKNIMKAETGGMDEKTGDYKGRENRDESVNLMLGDRRNAVKLKAKIETTRDGLLKLFDPKDTVGLKLPLEADDPPNISGFRHKTWAEANFGEGVPMGAAMTALIKIQADAKNAENIVVTKIFNEVGKNIIHLDKFAAVVVAPSSYVLVGQPYTAQIFLTAYDSQLNPKITVDGSQVQTEEGRGKYIGNTSTEGFKHWTGTITVTGNDGKQQTYVTDPQTYQVSKPSAVVSADKMNVLYIGVPNPVSVSAPGFSVEKLNVSINGGGGTVTGSAGHYAVVVRNTGTATVNVSGDITPGHPSVLGSTLFRIKPIPDPTPQFAGMVGGSVSAEQVKTEEYVFAKLEKFDFDATFKVIHFGLVVINTNSAPRIGEVNGNRLSEEMRRDLQTVKAGSTVVVKDIEAVGPDGKRRNLDESIVLSITN